MASTFGGPGEGGGASRPPMKKTSCVTQYRSGSLFMTYYKKFRQYRKIQDVARCFRERT